MSTWRRVGLAGGAGAALATVLLVVTRDADPARRALALLVGAALAVAVVGPWRAAAGDGTTTRARATRAALELLGALGGLGLVGLLGAPAPALLLGAAWVALFGLALVGLTLLLEGRPGARSEASLDDRSAGPTPVGGPRLGREVAVTLASSASAAAEHTDPRRRHRGRPGQALATGLGLLLVAWPYVGGPAAADVAPARRTVALERTLLTPVPVLGGTFAQTDVMRSGGLYAAFPLGQSLPFSYAAPRAALEVVGLAAVALAALALGRARLRGGPRRAPRVPVPLAVLALLALAPGEARAQLFPEPGGGGGEPAIGPLQTRVQLGYWVPDLNGYVKVDGFDNTVEGSKMYFDRVLDLEQIFVVPTFEVHLTWQNAGRISVQYFEAAWYGEEVTQVQRQYEEITFQPGSFIESRYRFRTIALAGDLQIPLTDFLTARLITTQRYVKFESKLRSVQQGVSDRNSVETLVPTVGVGLDVMIWQIISAYGEIQYLDFTLNWFGAKDGRWEFSYREWRVGVRLELVEHAHVMLEWFSLELTVEDGLKDRYKQDLSGPRLQVAILF